MDISKKFMDLNFLDEKVILNNKKILEENFNIDFNRLNDIVGKVKKSSKSVFTQLHYIAIEILGQYNTKIDDYFKSEITKDGQSIINNYLFENLKSNIFLYEEYQNIDKKEISQIEACKKYIKTQDENTINFFGLGEEITIKANEREEYKKRITDYNKKISNNAKRLKENNKIIDIFENKYLIKTRAKHLYTITSNVFINMVENINKNNSITTMKDLKELNRLKFNYYKNNQKSTYEIINNKKNSYSDLYFYERINNNHFVNSLYFEVKKLEKLEIEQQDLFEFLFPIIYLPNVAANRMIIIHMVYIYISNNYYKYKGDFEKQVKKMCLNLAFFTIPMYNMIFSVALYLWCRKVNENLSKIIKKYIDENKNEFINLYKNELNAYNISNKEIGALLKEIEFVLLTIKVNERINFKIYEKNNVIVKLSEVGSGIRELIFDNEIFLKIFKEIIQKIIFENNDI